MIKITRFIIILTIFLFASEPLMSARYFDRLGPYKEVTIKSITADGIVVFHQDGVNTISEKDLTDEEKQALEQELKTVARKQARRTERRNKHKQKLQQQTQAAEQILAQIQDLPAPDAIALLKQKLPLFKSTSPAAAKLTQKLAELETLQVELLLQEVDTLPLQTALDKLLQARHDMPYAQNMPQLCNTIELLEEKIRHLKNNPPETLLRIFRTKELPELHLNWAWTAGHLLHMLKYEPLRNHPENWDSAICKQRQERDFFFKELESTHKITACMIDSEAAIFSITYPSGQTFRFYNALLNEMLTFYLEKEPGKMKQYPGVARQYFNGYRKYFRNGGYHEFGTLRVLLLYSKKEIIAADFHIYSSNLQGMTLRAVNLDIITFEDFMDSYSACSGYFSLDALNPPAPADDSLQAQADSKPTAQ